MNDIASIFKNRVIQLTQPELNRRHIEPEEFMKLLSWQLKDYVKFGDGKFIIDDLNGPVITQLYLHLIGSDRFAGDLRKGVLLAGPIGAGKTLLLTAYVRVFDHVNGTRTRWLHSKTLELRMKDEFSTIHEERDKFHQFIYSQIFLDDIGKEAAESKDFGNVRKPFEDFISRRYSSGELTFATSNLKLEDLPYALHTRDRVKHMFNIMELQGKSRRK